VWKVGRIGRSARGGLSFYERTGMQILRDLFKNERQMDALMSLGYRGPLGKSTGLLSAGCAKAREESFRSLELLWGQRGLPEPDAAVEVRQGLDVMAGFLPLHRHQS